MSKILIAITVLRLPIISFLFIFTPVISPIDNAYADEKSAHGSLPPFLNSENNNISAYSENETNSNDIQAYSILALTNVASKALATGPVLEVNPTFFNETLKERESSEHPLILSNTGESPLTYSVSVTDRVSSDARLVASRSLAVAGRPPMRSIPSNVEYVPGELIVKLKSGYSTKKMSGLFRASGLAVKRRIPELNFEVLQLPSKDEESLIKALADVSADPGVVYAEPNYIYTAYDIPNDPRFDALWGLHNTGQTGGLIDADIDASEAWSISTGNREVVVAVIDTGVDYNHEDLAANMWINVAEVPGNRIDDDGNGYIDDIYGYDFAYNDADPMDGHYHGTHCAGTVGAAGGNGIGVVGVNHAVQIMAVKFLNDFGWGTTSDAVEAIMYAVDNGAHILSNSWGGGGRSAALEDAIVYANEHNALFVAAAGNDRRDTDIWPNYPSGYEVPNVMSIAATDHNDQLASFSNWGLTTVDLGAPGVNILSTTPDNSYDSLDGTSMATPHVSGVAALLKGHNPGLGALDLKDAIMETVDSVAALDGITVTGGRLNAEKALANVPPGWINVKGELSGEIEPGSSVELTVYLYGKSVGMSEADITIATNDPVHPEQVVPVELIVLPDDVAPDPVVDLNAADSTSRSVTLEWKATGDDGLAGRASEYDIRYSTAPLDETSWDSATQVEDEPAPAESGSVETFELTGLLPETRYWIGLKVKDDADRYSALSNVIEATTSQAPVLRPEPETMPPVWLEKNDETTRVLTLHNDGGDKLTFELRLARSAPAVDITLDRQVEQIAVVRLDTPNLDTNPKESDLKPYAEYSGDHLHFGITEYGEIMPFQYPIGTEHLRKGFYGSGYTVAYRHGGTDKVVYAGYGARSGMIPVSYEELENSLTGLNVRVTAESSDRVIRVVRTFDFDKSGKHVNITTLIKNISGTSVADVVFKSWSDWDVDGYFGSNTFDYDETYHLGYAYKTHYCGIASSREPDLRDLYGWDDYWRRLTDEDYRDGPVMMDGLEVLHFNLGDLTDAASEQVETTYVSGDSLEELQGQVGFFRWLSADITSGTISAGESLDIVLTYHAVGLEPGSYAADIIVASNDPVNPTATVPATIEVTADTTPPEAVTDLDVSDATFDSVLLAWTAVADSGSVGAPADFYDIRYSTEGITEANWDSASEAHGEPDPAAPGSSESFRITGLIPSTTFYFAMKVIDSVGLLSALSNIGSATTTAGPEAVVDPSNISETLMEGKRSTHMLTLSNTGAAALTYKVKATETSSSKGRSFRPVSYRSKKPAVTRSIPMGVEYVPGELIVKKLEPDPDRAALEAIRLALGAEIKRDISKLSLEIWRLPRKDRQFLLDAMAHVSGNVNVVYAEPNYIYRAIGIPGDPRFDALWGLHNEGQSGGREDADIDAPEAWNLFTGSSDVVVAVIDTGVDYNHVDLADNRWVNEGEIPDNGADDDGNGYVDDVYGYDFAYDDPDPMDGHYHGTHCAGTVGAAGDNGIGVVGVNHAVQIMAVKFLNDFGWGTTSDAVEAVMYAVDNGAHILSNSWGGGGRSAALEDAIVYANEHNALFVAAAGNDRRDTDIWPNYPSGYEVPNVMSIAATDHNDELASFSNWGLTTVDLGAPGVNILSTTPDNSYDSLDGSSMATPHVSGVAALLKGYNPGLGALDLKDAIMKTVDSVTALDGITVTGGRLNAEKALANVPLGWINVKGELSGEIEPVSSVALTVHLYGQSVGMSEADITIATNDPVHPDKVVPVKLNVLPDDVAPDPVVDLNAADATSRSVTLQWKATGDDGLTGRASEYDIRYSTTPLDETSWDSATQVEDEPAPAESGSVETFELTGLLPETHYWIGLKVKDNVDQYSALSNVTEATTAPAPVLRADPETMPLVWLEKNDETTRVLTLYNDGGDKLTFELRLARTAPAVDTTLDRQFEQIAVVRLDTPNLDTYREESDLKPYAEYSGDHLHFGITEYGEIMPFQYPVGTEHLRKGFYGAGYTVAYLHGGTRYSQ